MIVRKFDESINKLFLYLIKGRANIICTGLPAGVSRAIALSHFIELLSDDTVVRVFGAEEEAIYFNQFKSNNLKVFENIKEMNEVDSQEELKSADSLVFAVENIWTEIFLLRLIELSQMTQASSIIMMESTDIDEIVMDFMSTVMNSSLFAEEEAVRSQVLKFVDINVHYECMDNGEFFISRVSEISNKSHTLLLYDYDAKCFINSALPSHKLMSKCLSNLKDFEVKKFRECLLN